MARLTFESGSDSETPSVIFCWNFRGTKSGRSTGAKTTPSLLPPQPIPFALLSAHFLVLAAITIIVSDSFPKCFLSWQNLDWLILGALQKESTLEQHALLPESPGHPWFMPLAGELPADGLLQPQGNLMDQFYPPRPPLSCIITRRWRLNDHPSFTAEPWEEFLVLTLSCLPSSINFLILLALLSNCSVFVHFSPSLLLGATPYLFQPLSCLSQMFLSL